MNKHINFMAFQNTSCDDTYSLCMNDNIYRESLSQNGKRKVETNVYTINRVNHLLMSSVFVLPEIPHTSV